MAAKNGVKKNSIGTAEIDRCFQQAEKRLKRALANLYQAFMGLQDAVRQPHGTTRFKGQVIVFNEADEWDSESEEFIAGFDFRFSGHASVVFWRTWDSEDGVNAERLWLNGPAHSPRTRLGATR